MAMKRIALIALILLALLLSGCVEPTVECGNNSCEAGESFEDCPEDCSREGFVTAMPEEIDDVLTNPGMGFTTFHKIDGEMPYDQYPKSSIAYFRWYWRELEPEQGKIKFKEIDALLEVLQANDQKLAFRIMAADAGAHGLEEEAGVPDWLMDLGIKGTWYYNDEFDKEHKFRKFMPDFDDPIFLEHAEKLVNAFGERYGDHPAIDHVDVGFMGHWGEWHIFRERTMVQNCLIWNLQKNTLIGIWRPFQKNQ